LVLIALGAQVLPVLRIGGHLDRHALEHRETVALEAGSLGGIVGHQPEIPEPEVHQNLRADAVVAEVGVESERLVGLDGVLALVLQLVGADLVVQADPAAFLAQVDDDAPAFLLDHRQREVQLRSAVTAQ
jgi:hypothetical protein